MEREHEGFEPEDVELDDDLEALAVEDLDGDFSQEPDEEDLQRFMGT